MKKRLRVLVTGSSGFIGSNLVPYLIKKQFKVETFDLEEQVDIFDPRFNKFVENADVVVHLAALTSVNKSFKNPGEFYMTNVIGTAIVARYCVQYKKKLIYPSSAAIYHPELSPYADSKRLAEEIVLSIRDLIPVVVLRFFNVYGEHMNPRSGSVMYHFLNDKELIVYGDGEQTRDFVHVRDICSIIGEAISFKKWNSQIVDIGTGEAYSTNYIAGLFAHHREKKIRYEEPRREIKWSVADTQMLKKLYRHRLTTNIAEDIKKLCIPA